jgi:hypothetical protein
MNLIQLYDSTKKFAGWRQSYGQNSDWNLIAIVPFVGTKTLLFQAKCFGETVHGEHMVNIQFSGVNYSEEPNSSYKEIEYKGEKYWYERPTLKSEVTVRCSCPDMTYRFAFANIKARCWFGGRPKKYIKKTKRPPINPDNIAGMCKHLVGLQGYLHFHDYIS